MVMPLSSLNDSDFHEQFHAKWETGAAGGLGWYEPDISNCPQVLCLVYDPSEVETLAKNKEKSLQTELKLGLREKQAEKLHVMWKY